jgi:hypothetical protein
MKKTRSEKSRDTVPLNYQRRIAPFMFIDLENEADSHNFLVQHIKKKILHRFTVQKQL